MPRKPTGQVIEERRKRGRTFAIRFRAYGRRHYVKLGTAEQGWSKTKAQLELQNILADIRRGVWRPPQPEVVETPREIPTFHRFATEWFERQKLEGERRGSGLTAPGVEDLEWRICNHLLPAFAAKRLDQITVRDVNDYRLAKVRQGRLSPSSINKTLNALAAILQTAVEYELIQRNPAQGARRRLSAPPPRRSWLDRADHIAALLDGAGDLDRQARVSRGQRRTLLAVLIFAGLRIGEALALRWRKRQLGAGNARGSRLEDRCRYAYD